MQTRRKQKKEIQQKQQELVKTVCTSFQIDVKIKKPASFYRKKWRKARKSWKKVRRQKKHLEKALYHTIAQAVTQKVKRLHEYGDLEVVVKGVPYFFWKKLTARWEDYQPQRRRKGYTHYKKTHKSQEFLRSFPGVLLHKRVSSEQIMKITIGKKAAARMVYNDASEVLSLTFWYEPYPFPFGWIPMYRGTNPIGNCKHKTFWLEREIKKKK